LLSWELKTGCLKLYNKRQKKYKIRNLADIIFIKSSTFKLTKKQTFMKALFSKVVILSVLMAALHISCEALCEDENDASNRKENYIIKNDSLAVSKN